MDDRSDIFYKKKGLPPGTPVFVGKTREEEVKITVLDYDRERLETLAPAEADGCRAYLDRPTTTWINVDGLHQAEVIEKLGNCIGLHPLTTEDILHTRQRPKIDIYDDYVYLVVRMPEYFSATHKIGLEQVSFVLGKNYLVTFQEKEGDTFDAVRNRIKNNQGRIRKMGPDYLAYALLDSIVDNYFGLLEQVGGQIEVLEEELVDNPTPATLHKIHSLKREMILLRKSIWPLRELVNSLQREEIPFISESITFFLKDLYDHTIQVLETVETYRDIISGMLDMYLSSVSNRMNEIMKVLTIYAAIFIPLTFIAGVYGMNFNPAASPFNMPELNWYFGYPAALLLMAAVATALLIFFRKKEWL
jgi:magnesium transporter